MARVLRLPVYRRLFAAYTLNQLAWTFTTVALAVLVFRHTGSALGTAALFLCAQFIPALLGPALVARIDQLPARFVLPALYAIEALAFVALALVASSFSLAAVLVLALLDGLAANAARALARAATAAALSPAGLLRDGNALMNLSFSITFMAGPALAGVVVSVGGISAALTINGCLFALMALTLVTASALPRPPAERVPAAGRLGAALRHAIDRPVIWRLLSVQVAAVVFFTIATPVEVVLVQRTLHAGASGYGWLLTSWGAGAIAGSAVYARWRALPSRTLIVFGAGAVGVGFLVMALSPTIAVAVAGAAIGGAGNGVEAVAQRTALQEQVGDSWMARIMSFNESAGDLAYGPGIAIGGAAAAMLGPRAAIVIGGVGAIVVSAVMLAALAPLAHAPRAGHVTAGA